MCYTATPGKTGCLSAHFDGLPKPKKKVAVKKNNGRPRDILRRLHRTGPAHASPIHIREVNGDWDDSRDVRRKTHHTKRPKWRRIPTIRLDVYGRNID
jgi:hypothetical protein